MIYMDIRNIHTNRNSCRDTLHFHVRHCTKTTQYFYLVREKPLVAASKLGLLTIRWHSATRKHLFLYPQGDRSDWRKPKRKSINTNRSYHQFLSPLASLSWSNNKFAFSFHEWSRKRWGARFTDIIKHLPHKIFLLWYYH